MTAVLVPNRPGNAGGYQQLSSDRLALADMADLDLDLSEADDDLLPDRLKRRMVNLSATLTRALGRALACAWLETCPKS